MVWPRPCPATTAPSLSQALCLHSSWPAHTFLTNWAPSCLGPLPLPVHPSCPTCHPGAYSSLVLPNSHLLIVSVILWHHLQEGPLGFLDVFIGLSCSPWVCPSQASPHWIGILCLPRCQLPTPKGQFLSGSAGSDPLCSQHRSLTSIQSLLTRHVAFSVRPSLDTNLNSQPP